MKLKVLVIGLLLAGIALLTQWVKMNDLPKVLIIGDSISIGYTKHLAQALLGKAKVVHNPGNALHSGHGLANLDNWLDETKWDVIHFNHGLHDIKYVDKNGKSSTSKENLRVQIPLEQYEKNLEAIVIRLKKTGAKLIFATTTPLPDKPASSLLDAGQAKKYRAVALKIMKKHQIVVNDLNAFILPKLKELQIPNDVHFTSDGSNALSKEVEKYVLKAIE